MSSETTAPALSNSSTRPLRIIHYAPAIDLRLGGVVRAVLDWCTILAARGNDVTLVTFDSPDVPKDWDGSPGKPKVVRVPATSRPNGFVPAQAVEIFRSTLTGGGVVHMHCPWTASNMQMAKAARNAGMPYVVSIHGMLSQWAMAQKGLKKRVFLMMGGRKYMTQAARVHYTAEAEKAQSEKWLPGSRSAVIWNLMNLEPFTQLPGVEPAQAAFGALAGLEPRLLFLSRLHEKKGVHTLIDAAGRLKRAGQPFRLIIAGSGEAAYTKQLQDQVVRMGLGDCVYFVGMVSGIEKISLYQACDLFVLPTQQENFGIVLTESLAAGTPVVTTRGTDIWRELGSAGATIVENNVDDLTAAIARLLGLRERLPILGHRGREWVMENLNPQKIAAEYEAMYAQILNESGR